VRRFAVVTKVLFTDYSKMEKRRPFALAYPGILFGAWVQQIQLRTEDRDLGAVTP